MCEYREPCFGHAGRGEGCVAGAGSLGVRVPGCILSAGVRGCARLRLPTDVPAFAGTSVLMDGISGWLRESAGPTLREALVERGQREKSGFGKKQMDFIPAVKQNAR